MQPFAVQVIPPASNHTTFMVVAAEDAAHAMEQVHAKCLSDGAAGTEVVAVFDLNQVQALAQAMQAAKRLIDRAA